MSNISVALNRPLRGPHPEEATALAAKAGLLVTAVAVDEYSSDDSERSQQTVRGKPVGSG